MSQSSSAAAIVHPHPADVIGEVLDRRYVLLELTMGPGAGFYFVAYDLHELSRKRLRLLPDDSGCPSLDWYMVDELPEQPAQTNQSAAPRAKALQAKALHAKALHAKAPRAKAPRAKAPQPSQPKAVTPARRKPLTGPQRPLVSAQPPPLPPTLRAVPTAPAAPAAPKMTPAPSAAPASPELLRTAPTPVTPTPVAQTPVAQTPVAPTPVAPTADAQTTDEPYGDERHSTAVRLEAAWFAQGEQEELLAESLNFDDVYAGIARQAALDDLARVMSPEDLREHGLD